MPRDIGRFVAQYLEVLGWMVLLRMVLGLLGFGAFYLDFNLIICFWAAYYLKRHSPTARKWVIGVSGLWLALIVSHVSYGLIRGTEGWSAYVGRFQIENPPLWHLLIVGSLLAIFGAVPFVLLLTAQAKREFGGQVHPAEQSRFQPPVWSYRGVRVYGEHLFIVCFVALLWVAALSTTLWAERQQLRSFVDELLHQEYYLSAVDAESGEPIELLSVGLPGKGPDEVDPVLIKTRHAAEGVTVQWVGAKPFRCTLSASGYESRTVWLGRNVESHVLVRLTRFDARSGWTAVNLSRTTVTDGGVNVGPKELPDH